MQYGKTLLSAGVLLSLTTLNAQAALTVNDGGLSVYDSGLKATWTQDANLLGTLENTQGYNKVVNAVIAAGGGVIHDTPNYYFDNGTYTLTTADFSIGGMVDWWAGQAYVHYLDSLNNGRGYAGSNHWALPTTPDSSASYGFNITNSQLGELYYNELNATAYPAVNYGILGTRTFMDTSASSGPFSNAHAYAYWSGTEYASYPSDSWLFFTTTGFQNYGNKTNQFYAWAVSPGQVSAVPVPGAVWLFGTGLSGLLGLKRRGHTG